MVTVTLRPRVVKDKLHCHYYKYRW